jgi:hypothetical protein
VRVGKAKPQRAGSGPADVKSMLDRMLQGLLSAAILGMILACTLSGLGIGYAGVLRLLSGGPLQAGLYIAAGSALSVGAYLLCRHKQDLTWG